MEWSWTISDANMGLILSAVATLSGIWGLSADVVGALNASATLAGSWDMTGSLGALAWAVATLSGSWTMNNDITALAFLSADIYVNQSEASVQQIVDGVWNALAASYNTSWTMWEAAQTGGGGGGWLTPEQEAQLTNIDTIITENLDAKISDIRTHGGGGYGNIEWIRATVNNAKNEIKSHIDEKLAEIPQPDISKVEKQLNEINSHIDIAKDSVIDTINSTENEICSDIVRAKKETKEESVKTRNLVREKTKKIDENVSKLADRQQKTDEMIESESEELEKEFEKIYEEEATLIERDMEDSFNKEADSIESELTNQKTDGNE